MKNTRKRKLPTFHNEDEERSFWGTHDVTDFIDPTKGTWGIAAERYPTKTRAVSIRLPETLLANLKRIAQARDVAYQALVKLWLSERLTKEKLLESRVG